MRQPPSRAAILNYTGDRENVGCQATSRELCMLIHHILPALPESNLVRLPLLDKLPGPSFARNYLRKRLPRILARQRLSLADRFVLLFAAFLFYRLEIFRLLFCNYIFFQAEGTLTGTDLRKGAGLLVLPSVARRIFHKPLISLNQTLFSAHPEFDQVLSRCYQHFDIVAVRESASYQFARKLGLNQALLIPDAAFLTEASDDAAGRDLPKDYFCCGGSAVLRFMPCETLVEIICTVATRYHLEPVFILSRPGDATISKAVEQRLGSIRVISSDTNYRQVATVLKGARFLLSGRYHVSILAATVNTPIVSSPSNTFKNEGLIMLLNYPFPVREPEDGTGMLADIEKIVSNRDGYSGHLARVVMQIKANIWTGATFLRNYLLSLSGNSSLAAFERAAKQTPGFSNLRPPVDDSWDADRLAHRKYGERLIAIEATRSSFSWQ